MRIGNNPEKFKNSKNILKKHRVIIVFFIPDSEEEYFKDLDKILEKCLKSLFETINKDITNITLINNCSKKSIEKIVKKYQSLIDKYVIYSENKGKVYAVINEARSVYEEFVTISDADILFFEGWEKAVFDIYKSYPKAGVVSPYPCPYLTFYLNKSVFGWNSIINKIRYGKFVNDEDIDLYIKGTNLPDIIKRNSKFDWKQKQFILNGNIPAVIGAYHVVATYRAEQFRGVNSFPEKIFLNSYEEGFIDCLADYKGLYRLSTVKSYIYHMGNAIDEISSINNFNMVKILMAADFEKIKSFKKQSKLNIFINRMIGGIFIKYIWKKLNI